MAAAVGPEEGGSGEPAADRLFDSVPKSLLHGMQETWRALEVERAKVRALVAFLHAMRYRDAQCFACACRVHTVDCPLVKILEEVGAG